MPQLLACPFCREIFRSDEAERLCPGCGLELLPLSKVASGEDVLDEGLPETTPDPLLPWYSWRHGRGPLALTALLSIGTFFAPWIELIHPEHRMLSGFALARASAPWLWASPVAWFVMVPLVLTRRTRGELRGVRFICTIFVGLSLVDLILLALIPASRSGRVPIAFIWASGYWCSTALSAAGLVLALRLGRSSETRAGAPRSGTGAEPTIRSTSIH